MKWEILSTNLQKHDDMLNQRKQIEVLLIRAYTYLLRLYPAAFRADFADEMVDVFAMTLRESSDYVTLILTVWREIYGLHISLIRVHRQAYNQLPMIVQRRQQIRWFVRLIGGLIGFFLLSTLNVLLSPSYHIYAQAIPFVVALFVASVSMLLGLFWGRIGGLLTIASGAAIGCCMTLYLYVMAVNSIGIFATVLIGLIWALPFLIFGLLFYELSKLPKQSIASS